jgi:hypothetical protein
MTRRSGALLVALALALAPAPATAHDFEPGVLVLEETAPGRFDVAWSEPVDSQGSRAGVKIGFPPACVHEGTTLVCDRDLGGEVSFAGLHESRTQVVVFVRWLDGRRLERLVSGAAPAVTIEAGREGGAVEWIRLGVEHIVIGYDHVAFVLGLLLVVGWQRRLVATITAFTVAHSITLGLAATGLVRLPTRAVEAVIALSVVLVAREALHDRPTWTRTKPYVVAFLFGLVHGLGFAAALGELGLPRDGRVSALLFFNAGVEIGQLTVVGVAGVLAWISAPLLRKMRAPRIVVAYAIGAMGAAFFLERFVGIVAG